MLVLPKFRDNQSLKLAKVR